MEEELTDEFGIVESDDSQQLQDRQLFEHYRFEVDRGQDPVRIDKYMCEKLQHSSRNRIQKAADAGQRQT